MKLIKVIRISKKQYEECQRLGIIVMFVKDVKYDLRLVK